MILNTISRGLLTFPETLLEQIKTNNYEKTVVDDMFDDEYYQEFPLGALITSEYSASSFLTDTGKNATPTDPAVDDIKAYLAAFPEEKSYNSDFQGALHGRRLKRIWEAASTSASMASTTNNISEDLGTSLSYVKGRVDLLTTLALACNCSKCKGICSIGPATPCMCGLCNNNLDPCGILERITMEGVQDEIPKYYENDTSLMQCKILELKYASKLFQTLAMPNWLSFNADYADKSFYNSDEEKEMKEKLYACHSTMLGASGIEIPSRISSLIKASVVISETENKGNWDPTSTVPERDIATNLDDLEVIYNSLLEVKSSVDPDLSGIPDLAQTYFSFEKNKSDIQTFDPDQAPAAVNPNNKLIVEPYTLVFSSDINTGVSVSSKTILKYSGDPATFYLASAISDNATIISKQNVLTKILSKLFNWNVEFADAQGATPAPEGLEELNKTECSPLIEIPIGKATDQALNLTKDILDELASIRDNILSLPHKIFELEQNQESFYNSTNALLDITKECKKSCTSTCSCSCGVMIETPCVIAGVPSICCESCSCNCTGPDICPNMTSEIESFNTEYNKMNQSYSDIKETLQEISDSFKKLNSEDDYYLGKDACCINNNGNANCRDDDNNFIASRIQQRDYTLKEKLVMVQLLLNKSRQISAPQKEESEKKSDYKILVDGLKNPYKKMAFTTFELQESTMVDTGGGPIASISYLDTAGLLLDLSNCGFRDEEVEEDDSGLVTLKQDEWILMNSADVKGVSEADLSEALLNSMDKEVCVPDPLLDCYYDTKDLQKSTPYRSRSPYNCYFHIEDIEDIKYPENTKIPEGGNLMGNLYCCVPPRQPEKELE